MTELIIDQRPELKGVVEFHITNTCNLDCKWCNRFSNYRFKGWQRWDDYKEIYAKWAEKINFPDICIIGGEPMLNPEFMQWFVGLRELWPNSKFTITTNGTRLDKVPGLYEEVLKHKEKTVLDVSIHSSTVHESTIACIKNFLQGSIETDDTRPFLLNVYNTIKKKHWPDTIEHVEDVPETLRQELFDDQEKRLLLEPTIYRDSNGVEIVIQYSIVFNSVALFEQGKKFKLHKSDPEKAHKICYSNQCHTMYKGKFYKCPMSALLPEFINQFDVELSNSDRDIIFNVEHVDSNSTVEEIVDYWNSIEDLTQPIPLCKFCPEKSDFTLTGAKRK